MPEEKQIHDKKEDEKKIAEAGASDNVGKTDENKEPEQKSATDASDKKKPEKKKEVPKKPKKTEAVVNVRSLPISFIHSKFICKFIKGKKIEKAIADLEDVVAKKRAVAMKGEYAHRKGEGVMAGRYPKKASENFIKILKSLQANSNVNGLDEPVIVEAVANIAQRPYGRFGRTRKKRTHVSIKVKEKGKK